MILPVFAYGQPVLKKIASPVEQDYPDLGSLISNMWETMYAAHGVGLAAPQIGLGIRLFVVDTVQIADEKKDDPGIKKVFINAEMIHEFGKSWSYEEGCLSIPNIRGDVERLSDIRIKYMDEQFNWHEESFSGIHARVIQHEYDHIEGKLFIEKLKPLKKKLIQGKLNKIKSGEVSADYKLKFARI